MAKLSDLRALVEAARTPRAAPGAADAATVAPGRDDAATPPSRDARVSPPSRTSRAAAPSGGNASVHDIPSARRRVAAAKHADGDIDLAAAFADVERLPPPRRARIPSTPPTPVPRQRIADEADALLASKFGAEPAPHRWEAGQEQDGEQTYVRKGLGTDVLAKLRRGHWAVQAEIDLHGHNSDEAHDALADFLLEARTQRLRCVRVIHGKGLTSPGREPVLKGKVRRWLAHWDEVLAFAEAPQHAGGGGAVLVLLRGSARA